MATCPQCQKKYDDNVSRCADDGQTLLPDAMAAGFDQDLKSGDLVGEYRVEKKIGEGGFGKVYAAQHPVIGKRAAIKVLNREYSSNLAVVSRFVSEAKAVNQIRHRNIIDIFSMGPLPDGRQYLIMELLDGLTVDAYLDRHGRMSPEEALPILRQLARALDAAHAAGIAHRDLKPENVYLTFDDEGSCFPKLLDFGIAKLLGDDSVTHKTRTGAAMGTPLYMSPEQCRGKNVDHRTDIYSFGVLTHQILTGKLPFDGDSMMDLMFKHAEQPPPPMSQALPALPAALDAPVLEMLAKSPAERPANLVTAVEALADAARAAGFDIEKRTTIPEGKRSGSLLDKSREITGDGLTTSGEADTVVAGPAPAATLNTVASSVTSVTPAIGGNGRGWLFAGAALVVIGIASVVVMSATGDPDAAGHGDAVPATAITTSAPASTATQTTEDTTSDTVTSAEPETTSQPSQPPQPVPPVAAPPRIEKAEPAKSTAPSPKPPPKAEPLPDDLESPF